MWTKVKHISKYHPDEVIRQYAKHLLAKMNSGLEAEKEVNFLIQKHYHELESFIR